MTQPTTSDGKVIAQVIYVDVRGIDPRDIQMFMSSIREQFTGMGNEFPCTLNTLFLPIRGESRVEYSLLDLEQVKIAKTVTFTSFEDWKKEITVNVEGI